MKRYLIIYVILSIPSLIFSQNKSSLQEDNIFGKVRIIYESIYSHNREYGYKENGELPDKYINKYNEYGNITHSNYQSEFSNQSYTYEYLDNRLVKSYSKGKYGNQSIIYSYDNNGFLVKRQHQNQNGLSSSYTIYKYDESGLRIEIKDVQVSFNGKTTFRNISTYKYDNLGRIVEWELKDYVNSKGSSVNKTSYDKIGNIIFEEYYRDNSLIRIEKFNYRNFDKKGNWLIKLLYKDNELIQITERTIEYY